MKVFIACIVALLCVAAVVTGGYVLALHALSESQHALCPIVRLVTAHPIPRPANPKANPSRMASYEFYRDFVAVKKQYHC